MSQSSQRMRSPPYPPTTAGMGGIPTVGTDVPATAVFLALYIAFAATNMTILQVNLKRKHKFILNGLLFGFCMARVATTVLRIAWATRQTNARLAMAANIFINAGILIVYIVNIILAQRILRAKRPQLGWNKALRALLKVAYALIGLALAGVITSVVLSSYTLNMHTRQVCRDIQLTAVTYLTFLTTIPWFLLALAYFTPSAGPEEHFGQGSITRKTVVLLGSTILAVTISGFKCGTSWMPPRPANNPAWYHSKAAFYIFNFALEIVILALLTASRIDKLFHIPDGSKGPGDYTSGRITSSQASEHGDEEIEKV